MSVLDVQLEGKRRRRNYEKNGCSEQVESTLTAATFRLVNGSGLAWVDGLTGSLLGASSRGSNARLNLRCHHEEGLLHIGGVLGGGFYEWNVCAKKKDET